MRRKKKGDDALFASTLRTYIEQATKDYRRYSSPQSAQADVGPSFEITRGRVSERYPFSSASSKVRSTITSTHWTQ